MELNRKMLADIAVQDASTFAQLVEVAKSRRAEPQALSKLVRGDLDWIVMKALEKDRTRRYGTAAAIAVDIERHLNDEPVSAGPPGAGYKLRKFIRRHQLSFVASAFILVTLLFGFALAMIGFVNTPPRIAWYTTQFPGLEFLLDSNSTMAEYGYRHGSDAGGEFRSRFDADELRRQGDIFVDIADLEGEICRPVSERPSREDDGDHEMNYDDEEEIAEV